MKTFLFELYKIRGQLWWEIEAAHVKEDAMMQPWYKHFDMVVNMWSESSFGSLRPNNDFMSPPTSLHQYSDCVQALVQKLIKSLLNSINYKRMNFCEEKTFTLIKNRLPFGVFREKKKKKWACLKCSVQVEPTWATLNVTTITAVTNVTQLVWLKISDTNKRPGLRNTDGPAELGIW